jgi:hypothetical protein
LDEPVEKASDAEVIHKAFQKGLDRLIDQTMKDNPALSRDQARLKAMDSEAFSALHRGERLARLGV